MTTAPNRVFHPAEGALLDLESLLALANASSRLLGAWGELHLGERGGVGVVLSGLELEGQLMDLSTPGQTLGAAASPGVVRVRLSAERRMTLGPGSALVQTREGLHQLVRVTEPIPVPLPPPERLTARPVLALTTSTEPEAADGAPAGICARATLQARLTYVAEASLKPIHLPLAAPASVNDSADWAHDYRRFWAPGHPALDALIGRIDALQRRVWEVQPRGSVFDSHHYGDEWTRYQTVATAALQAALQSLGTRPTHTDERLRALELLARALRRSVEDVGNELLQALGGAKAAGPYAALRARLIPESQ